eukprot:1537526-Amphidinium_carterae.1
MALGFCSATVPSQNKQLCTEGERAWNLLLCACLASRIILNGYPGAILGFHLGIGVTADQARAVLWSYVQDHPDPREDVIWILG